jgi:integrase
MAKDPIKTVVLADGSKRYRFVVDIGRDPVTGKRQQKTMTFDKKGDARRELDRIRHQTNEGTYVKSSEETVNAYLDTYIKGATRGRRESTKRNYRDAFRCVRDQLGDRRLQSLTKADVEDLVEYMLTTGRKRGGKPGTGLSARSVNLTLGRLTAALEMAVLEGKLARNVAKLVEKEKHTPAERQIWSKVEVRKFLRVADVDRLRVAWRLSLYGLRRGEVCGLRWCDIDLKAGTLAITQTRILVEGEIRIEDPKSRNGFRKLPLDAELLRALKDLRKRQASESETAGEAYEGSEYVVTDELGRPVHPEWYSDEFERLLKQAAVRRIRLHDSRHTALSLMEHAGVPISVISKWAGHYDTAFTYSTYVHATEDDLLKGAQAMAKIHKIA